MSDSTIKDMLRKGATADDLMKILQRDIEKANKELEEERAAQEMEKKKAEAKRNADLDMARTLVVSSLMRYLICLGVIKPEDNNTENRKAVAESIKETEKSFKAMLEVSSTLEKMTNMLSPEKNLSDKQNFCVNPEKILQEYIHNIM